MLTLNTYESMEYKNLYGQTLDVKPLCGKSFDAYVEYQMKEIMNVCNTGNVAQTRQFVTNRFKDDKSKGLLKNEVNGSNFKKDMPIIIHNKMFKLIQTDNGYSIECGLFNREKQKETAINRVTFIMDKLDGNGKSTLNRIISGQYKQGSGQIIQDKKGKWYFIISFSFEPEVRQLDTNRILGVDLGITNAATMQIWDETKQDWDRLSYKECMLDGKELIHFRQKIEARKRDFLRLRKVTGITNEYSKGKKGHGTQARIKPIENLNDKIANFRDTMNHKYSKYIVDMALKNNCGIIQMENLEGFTEKAENSFLKSWSYYDLQSKIIYKAKEHGIEVIKVNPKYTSKRCSKCGCIHNDNRDCKNNQSRFECVVCGYGNDGKVNADINAAKNIALPNIDEIIKEQVEIQKAI
jgi:IS605 OrfB family transposase